MQQHLTYSLEKLCGQANYGTWSFAMEMMLTDLDLWECIHEGWTIDTQEAKKKDAKARSKICLMVKENIYPMIMSNATARETWEALRRAYADTGLLRRLYILRKLFNVKLSMFENMEDYLNDIQKSSQDLIAIKAGLDDEFIGIIMLAGLTENYNPLVMTMEHSNVKISTETVMASLLKESSRKITQGSTSTESDTAMTISKKSFQGICHICKKRGHKKWQCAQKKKSKVDNTEKKSNNESTGMIAALSAMTDRGQWIVDSGATSHMTSDIHGLEDRKSISSKWVTTANNDRLLSSEQGNVYVMGRSVRFEDVLMIPNLTANLLSVGKMCSKGYTVVFDRTSCKVYNKDCNISVHGKPTLTASQRQGLYIFNHGAAMVLTDAQETSCTSFDLWHRRLGHLSGPLMLRLKSLTDGLTFKEVSTEPCEACCKGKECVKKFPKGKSKRASDLLELVHSDLAGPMEVESWGGNRYFLIFVDDFSRKTFVYLLKSKTEVPAKFIEYKAMVENQTGKKIKKLRSDCGTEYVNQELQNFLKEHGIQHQKSVPYTPQQNGVAERTIRTITEKARCMVHDAGLDKKFWGEAVTCAVYLKNRSPTMALKDKVPEEAFTGERVDLSNLRLFGCKAQVLVKNHTHKKFDSKTVEMVMTGYSSDSKAYRFINMNGNPRKVVIARDVTFMEKIPKVVEKQDTPVSVKIQNIIGEQTQVKVPVPVTVEVCVPEEHTEGNNNQDTEDSVSSCPNEIVPEVSVPDIPISIERYPLRNRLRRPETELWEDAEDACNYHVTDSVDPVSVQDVIERSDKKLWIEAMKDEYNSLLENGTWELVNRPLDSNVVKTKWVFKLKVGADGSMQRHKARLVAKGYSQRPGEDYFDTFAPVVRMSSIRLLLALAAEKGLKVNHIDVTTAFLNGDLKEEIYMEQPECFIQKGREGMVCKLKKAIYGLKQAAKCWNEKIHDHIVKMGFMRSKYDACVYTKINKKMFTVIALYVDDFYIFTNSDKEAKAVKRDIGDSFKIKDLGQARECLGIQVIWKNDGIYLSQKKYITKLLEKYQMQDAKPVSTPVEKNVRLKPGVKDRVNPKYQEIVGSLMYLACSTRPDIAYAVTMLSQFNNCNDEMHMTALKRVLRYLRGTSELSLHYTKRNSSLVAYADADWGNGIDAKSFSGYVLVFGGAAVSWQSAKQKCVSLSTAEAEYIAISETAKEVISVKGLFSEITGLDKAVTINSDSQSASKLVYSPVIGKRSKHVNIRYHFVRELAQQEQIVIKYVDTNHMPADMLTKGLDKGKHVFCSKHIGLRGDVELMT